MAKTPAELKQKFEAGDKPTAQDFIDLIDSLLNVVGTNFPNPLPAVSAEKLTKVGDALPAILPARDGSQLTNINPAEYNVPPNMPLPSYATATTFVLTGDWTIGSAVLAQRAFLKKRRLELTIAAVPFFTEVADAVFAAGITTVTTLNAMPSNQLTAAKVGVIRPFLNGGAVGRGTIGLGKGEDIASAATVNFDTSTGDLIDVTGTTTITAITLAEGVEKTVRFTGILTLTNGASLVLPGTANITTAAGDFAVFRGYAAGVVRCVDYVRTASPPDSAFISTLRDDANFSTAQTTLGLVVKRKTADESVTSSTVLQDDDHLTFAIAANEEWVAEFFLDFGAALNVTGVKVSVTSPSGSTLNQVAAIIQDTTTGTNVNAAHVRSTVSGTDLPFAASTLTGAASGFVHISYWVLNGATPGNITLQFAQSTSSATAVTLRKGSHMLATRVA